jgi:hypothetical protein
MNIERSLERIPRYQRIRIQNGRSVILRNPRELDFLGTRVVSGVEVNIHGAEMHGRGYDTRTRVIELALIRARVDMHMDNHYGMLSARSATTGEINLDSAQVRVK